MERIRMARTVRLQQVSITMAGSGAGGLVQAFLVLGQKDHYGWLGLVQTFKARMISWLVQTFLVLNKLEEDPQGWLVQDCTSNDWQTVWLV